MLERLRQVTSDQTFQQNISKSQWAPGGKTDQNYNNIQREMLTGGISSLNTAGNCRNEKIEIFEKVSADIFESQVICDPHEKSHSLHSSPRSHKSVNVSEKTFIHSRQIDNQVTETERVDERIASDGEIKQKADIGTKKCGEPLESPKINEKDMIEIDKSCKQVHEKGGVKEAEKNLNTRNILNTDIMFHQVLEAEKPNEEEKVHRCGDISSDHSVKSNDVSFEEIETKCLEQSNEHFSEKKSDRSLEIPTVEPVKPKKGNSRIESREGKYDSNEMNSNNENISDKTKTKRETVNNKRGKRSKLDFAESTSKQPVRKALEVSDLPTIQTSVSPQSVLKGKQPMQATIGEVS